MFTKNKGRTRTSLCNERVNRIQYLYPSSYESQKKKSKVPFIVIRYKRDEEHCLVEEVYGSVMGNGVVLRAFIKIRHATLPRFTSYHCNIDSL